MNRNFFLLISIGNLISPMDFFSIASKEIDFLLFWINRFFFIHLNWKSYFSYEFIFQWIEKNNISNYFNQYSFFFYWFQLEIIHQRWIFIKLREKKYFLRISLNGIFLILISIANHILTMVFLSIMRKKEHFIVISINTIFFQLISVLNLISLWIFIQ